MPNQNSGWSRWGGIALGLSGLLFAAFPLVRPFYADIVRDPVGAAQTISMPTWTSSHLMLLLALVLLPFGFLAVFAQLESSNGGGAALTGLVLGILGGGLFLPVVGVEAFALPAMAQQYLLGQTPTLEAIDASHRALQSTVFAPGLVLLGLGGVFSASAVWRSSRLPRWAGVPLAIGLVCFFPLLPQIIRTIDGMLIGVGGVWLGWAIWRLAVPERISEFSRVTAEVT